MIALLAMWSDAATGGHSVTQSMGRQANLIEHEWWFFFWICASAFVVTMLFLARAITQRSADRPLTPETPQLVELKPERERKLTIAVSVATGITVITLF